MAKSKSKRTNNSRVTNKKILSSSVLDISRKDRRGVSCSVDENVSLESVKKCLDNISILPKEDLVW